MLLSIDFCQLSLYLLIEIGDRVLLVKHAAC